MTFTALLQAVRRRWLMVLIGVLAGAVVALAVTLLTPRTYSSTASLYVSALDNSSNAQNAYEGGLLSQQRVKSYSEIMVSARVLQPVIDQFGLGETPADFAEDVAVGADTDSTVLRVTVSARDPGRAADLANAVSARFIGVVGQLERPRVPGAAPSVDVSVVDQASPVPTPVSPRLPVNLAVGLVLGLVLGAAAAILRSSTDTSVRSAAELATMASRPSLGILPLDDRLATGEQLTSSSWESAYGEAVRRVRTNLLFADVDNPPSLITVTSSDAGEGKTTLVCALAAAFGATLRVVVVEGDLRRPTMAARLGLVDGAGLTHVLGHRMDVEAAIQRWRPGVDVLTSGLVPPDPSELLSSHQMGDLLEKLRSAYDLVIVDAPPLEPVADAAILASRSDGALLLCRAGVTRREKVSASLEALSTVDARLFGTVLTMTPATKDGSYYGYAAGGAPASSGVAPAPGPDGARPGAGAGTHDRPAHASLVPVSRVSPIGPAARSTPTPRPRDEPDRTAPRPRPDTVRPDTVRPDTVRHDLEDARRRGPGHGR